MMRKELISHYGYGRSKEKKVLSFFKGRGWGGKLSGGSKGPADIELVKGPRKWVGQIKATRKGEPPGLSKKERTRLKIKATKTRAIPVLIQVVGGKIVNIESVRSGRRLNP